MKSFIGDEIVSKRNENSHIQTHMLVHLDIQAVRHLVILQQKNFLWYISLINSDVSMCDLQYFIRNGDNFSEDLAI